MKNRLTTTALADVCSLVTDGTHDTPKRVEEGFPLVKAKEIVGGTIDFETCDQISEPDHRKVIARSKPEQFDTLFAHIGASLGEAALVRTKREFSIKNVALFKPDPKKIDGRYLYYLVVSPQFQALAKGTKTGSAQPFLGLGQLRVHQIQYHADLPTQRRIAGILSAYDELIENNLRRIRILEEMAQSLYREWFVHFRIPPEVLTQAGLPPKLTLTNSPLGPIPDGWEVKTVEDALKRFPAGKKYSQKTVDETGAIPVLDQGKSGIIGYHNDEPGFVATEDNPVIVFANHTCYQRIIQYPFSAIQNVLPFRSAPDLARNLYWLHWATKDLIEFNDYKGHWPEFIAKNLLVPPTEICSAFGVFAEKIVRSVYSLERRNQTLRQTRDLLLPKLLSPRQGIK
ncbi:restriction endonuclease subunit S [Roseibacillus persicicus]|uniref:Specificity protein S n=1 Tax=Roseibacillus persicicus TaxID=454148 RepID=A0A918TLA9_9BACT|nr:restriction endonuclease subunit S [Roseibacillus persicicus]GHC54384.1 specificity protein S [Roseibacillus persicicus]